MVYQRNPLPPLPPRPAQFTKRPAKLHNETISRRTFSAPPKHRPALRSNWPATYRVA